MKKIKPIKSGIPCTDCGEDIPKQRLDACKGTTKCVKCSDVKTKKPIVIQKGEGDHTYTETIIVDDETYKKYKKLEEAENKLFGKNSHNISDDDEVTKKDINLDNLES